MQLSHQFTMYILFSRTPNLTKFLKNVHATKLARLLFTSGYFLTPNQTALITHMSTIPILSYNNSLPVSCLWKHNQGCECTQIHVASYAYSCRILQVPRVQGTNWTIFFLDWNGRNFESECVQSIAMSRQSISEVVVDWYWLNFLPFLLLFHTFVCVFGENGFFCARTVHFKH